MNDRSVYNRSSRTDARTARLPPSMASEGARGKILQAALRLFATQGFHASSIREIVKLAELQVSTVYAHFPSKEHVLAELARLGHEVHFDALATLLETGADPIAHLRAFVRTNAVLHATYPHLAVLVNNEMSALSDDLAAPSLALRGQTTALLLQILDRGTRSGCFSTPGIDVTAAAILAMAMRIPYWYAPDGGVGVEELADRQAILALRMVGAGA